MADIVVLVDDLGRFATLRYFVHLMIPEWRAAGHRVAICADPRRPPAADLAVLHVDSTRVPAAYLEAAKRYPACLNRATHDISKRRVSRQLVTAEDAYAGPVIVKTDANCGGVSERARRYATPLLGRLRRKLDRRRHWSRTGLLAPGNYPVYSVKGDVPPPVWNNPALVVERFLPERRDGLYGLRQWVFMGAREIAKVSYSDQPIIKAGNVVASEPLDQVPESLRGLRAELGFDYGKFDYVMHEGEAVLLDANRTPTYGERLGEQGKAYAALLATGIDAFLA